MAMTVLPRQYSQQGGTKYLTGNSNVWMGGRGAMTGPQYQRFGGTKYLRSGMGVGPTRQWGRSQTGSGRFGKYMNTAQDMAKLGYSSTYRDVLSRVRYPGVTFRRFGARNLGQVIPGSMRTDHRTPIDTRYGQKIKGPTIWTMA